MKSFEEVLTQFEPMITAAMRSLNIYRDHDQFRQTARIALWRAWQRYNEDKGEFAPFASMSIRGSLLDQLKSENRFIEREAPFEKEMIELLVVEEDTLNEEWKDKLANAVSNLSTEERQLLNWIFIERLTLANCADRSGITVAGTKKRRKRILEKLREELTNCP